MPRQHGPRCAVVDLGSNSVRLVVFAQNGRNPVTLFNEKAVVRLGRGLHATGNLSPAAMAETLKVLARYKAVAEAMGAAPFEVLATAAMREAENGAQFAAELQALLGPAVPIRILSGSEEATLAAEGVLCGIPTADGLLADIGGGSLEIVRVADGAAAQGMTLPLGVIRLGERAGGDPARARQIVEQELEKVPFMAEGTGRDLYLVGGAWRALAHIHLEQTAYPLSIVHHYTITHEQAVELATLVGSAGRRALERLPGISRRRIDDLPFATVVLRRLLRQSGARRVVFSANGVREGWYLRQIAASARGQDPLLAACHDYARQFSRDPDLPPRLIAWTAPLFASESTESRRLREAACWLSDLGAVDHPEFRTEQSFFRVLRQPGVGIDHHARAFLALTVALRYEAEPDAPFLRPARLLLDVVSAHRAESLGMALRLAYSLSGGTAALLARVQLSLEPRRLVLTLDSDAGMFAGESVLRRLDRLAQAMGMESEIRMAG